MSVRTGASAFAWVARRGVPFSPTLALLKAGAKSPPEAAGMPSGGAAGPKSATLFQPARSSPWRAGWDATRRA